MVEDIAKGKWPTFQDVLKAHADCRVGKPASSHQTKFETRLGENLLKLSQDIQNKTYKPQRSVCFIVTNPKPREIFAAHFRDRIVHHLIISKLNPIWESRLSNFSFACRKGRGTHGALRELQRQVRQISEGGNKTVYVLQLDVASFFVSINRTILKSLMIRHVKDETTRWLIELLFSHDSRKDVIMQSSRDMYKLIPASKSWFSRGSDEGIPIGNLTSQFGANLYLNEIDHWIERSLKPEGYLRYMDDLTFFDKDREKLRAMIEPVDSFLHSSRKQNLNRKKTTLKSLRHGINYLGYKIKQTNYSKEPAKLYLSPKKKWEFIQDLRALEAEGLPDPIRAHPLSPFLSRTIVQKRLSSINSRLGLQKHAASFLFREEALKNFAQKVSHGTELPEEHSLQWEPVIVKKDFSSIKIR